MVRWFRPKDRSDIKEWRIGESQGFKPYAYHVIRVDMATREITVLSLFGMVKNIFFGKVPEFKMTLKTFDAMFGKNGIWKKNWVDVTKHYKDFKEE